VKPTIPIEFHTLAQDLHRAFTPPLSKVFPISARIVGPWPATALIMIFSETPARRRERQASRSQQAMLNVRVSDLDAMLAQLRAHGADVAGETQDMEGVGRFGWVTDPEGNRVELWQPA